MGSSRWTVALSTLFVGALGVPALAETFECMVEPYLEVNLSSAVPGILDQVNVDRGDRVESGQVLARLRSDLQEAHLELITARVKFAERKVLRNEELYRKQMISIHEKDELETEVQLSKLELREVEEQLKLRVMQSPLDGVVVDRFYSPGEFVQEDPIFTLVQIDPLRVEVAVPTRLWGKIQVGMTADVEWETPVGGVHRATVTIVDPVVDAASGTIGVRLELPNPEHRLPAGAKCSVQFPVAAGLND